MTPSGPALVSLRLTTSQVSLGCCLLSRFGKHKPCLCNIFLKSSDLKIMLSMTEKFILDVEASQALPVAQSWRTQPILIMVFTIFSDSHILIVKTHLAQTRVFRTGGTGGESFPTSQEFAHPPPGKIPPVNSPPHHQIFIPQWHIQGLWETGIPVWALKLWRPANTFRVFFFQLHFNKKYVDAAICDF